MVGIGLGPNFQATAAFSLVRQLAASISVVVATVFYNREVQLRESAMVAAVGSALAAEITAASTATAGLTQGRTVGEKEVVLGVINKALWYVWLLYACLSALGLVISCTVKDLHYRVS